MQNLKPLSSPDLMKFFDLGLTEELIVDILSDIKHRVFPRPFERLYKDRNKQGLVGIEIGVAGGEHSLSLFKTLDIKRLYCIDPYELYDGYEVGIREFGVDRASLSDSEINARNILTPYLDRIVWLKYLSDQAFQYINEPVDFVYIDGNHSEFWVNEDIKNYYPLVKSGGVIGGHDFFNGFAKHHSGLVKAITEFSVKNNLQLYLEVPDWWIVKP